MATQSNGVVILTGGPGTGKTTTINGIIRYFEMEGLDIYLAAPTGRAAKRMTELRDMKQRRYTECWSLQAHRKKNQEVFTLKEMLKILQKQM